ncbi:MAG: hemolysin III family protein [Calditrichia bacterium]
MKSHIREPANALTHLFGTVFAVAGSVILIWKSAIAGKSWQVISFAIFGAGLILLYTASTLYHWLPLKSRGVARLRKLDHMMIFVLIAATYTPVCLIPLRGPWGWSLLAAVWAIALGGIFLVFFAMDTPRWFSTLIYVLMGWLAVSAIWPLIQALSLAALLWILIGGLFYTIGAIIYACKKPDPWPGQFGFHAIFHIFVLLGSFSHYWLMYRYILPMS